MRSMPLLAWTSALALGATGLISTSPSIADQAAFVGVNIVDVVGGGVIENQTIIINDGWIVNVQDAQQGLPDGIRVVDAKGKYAIPGLIDSHVHYAAPDVYDPLMIAHGVALVREMGAETGTVLAFRDERASGERKGPRMLVTGAIVDGSPPFWPFSEAVDTPEEGRAAVRKLHEAGVDFIKVYQGLKPDVHAAICDEAQRVGLMPLGHVPSSMSVGEAIANGQRTIEHLSGFDALLRGALYPDEESTRDFIALGRTWAELDSLTDDEILAVVAPYADANVAETPTLAVFDGVSTFASDDGDPNDRYHPAMMRSFWDNGPYKEWGKAVRHQIPGLLRCVGALHDAGATIIAGTDLANPGVVAGVSLHRELALFVEAGLSPIDAIRSATSVPAAFFGIDDLGAIETGKEASFLLLNTNPIENIAATTDTFAVVHRGDVHDRASLDRLFEEAAEAADASSVVADALDDGRFALPEFSVPGRVVAQGIYKYKFGDFDAGTEQFRITQDESGYILVAHAKTTGGPQPPYVMTLHVDLELAFRSGAYRVLRGNAPPAVYARNGENVTATAGDETQSVTADAGAIFAGSAATADFATLQSYEIEVGESVNPVYYGFGNPSWRWNEVSIAITRLDDGTVTLPDGRAVATRVYLQVIPVPGMGEFRITSQIDDLGVVVASSLKMPMGTLTIELVEYTRN